jgi:hypothetical protein
MRSPEKWKKLLRGEADVPYIAQFLLRKGADALRQSVGRILRTVGLRPPSPLAEALRRYATGNRPLRFVFSASDPGLAILRAEAGGTAARMARRGVVGIDVIDGADHTFSRRAPRELAIDAIRLEARAILERLR